MEKFNPLGKTFMFKLDEYTCYKCKTGKCSLEEITLEELESLNYSYVIGESDIKYCRGMAKLFLDTTFTSPADIYFKSKCSHYQFSGGQHRTCVVARLLKKGSTITLNANLTEDDGFCRYCSIQKDFKIKNRNLSFADKFLRTKKYRSLKIEIAKYNTQEFIYRFPQK